MCGSSERVGFSDFPRSTNAAALVITGQAKFFSNGLDIDFLMTNHESASAYLSNYQKILSRLISLNLPLYWCYSDYKMLIFLIVELLQLSMDTHSQEAACLLLPAISD